MSKVYVVTTKSGSEYIIDAQNKRIMGGSSLKDWTSYKDITCLIGGKLIANLTDERQLVTSTVLSIR